MGRQVYAFNGYWLLQWVSNSFVFPAAIFALAFAIGLGTRFGLHTNPESKGGCPLFPNVLR
jgi:hypothetical protein